QRAYESSTRPRLPPASASPTSSGGLVRVVKPLSTSELQQRFAVSQHAPEPSKSASGSPRSPSAAGTPRSHAPSVSPSLFVTVQPVSCSKSSRLIAGAAVATTASYAAGEPVPFNRIGFATTWPSSVTISNRKNTCAPHGSGGNTTAKRPGANSSAGTEM